MRLLQVVKKALSVQHDSTKTEITIFENWLVSHDSTPSKLES